MILKPGHVTVKLSEGTPQVDGASAVLLQYGAVGAIAILAIFATRVMFGKLQEAYDREKDRADRLEVELQRLNELVRSEYINTISHASQAISDANRAVADALAAVRRG